MKSLFSRNLARVVLRGMAMSALTNLAMPVAEAWAADEVQVLRKSPDAGTLAAVPFTTFQQEEQAIANSLPCKWISKDGRLGPSYGNARYDFLCKGGDFATVNLYLDKSSGNGVAKVRLLYREWLVNTNPNAGEAVIAQQFLRHVAGRFIPAGIAADVMDSFWSKGSDSWSQGGVKIVFKVDKGEQFNVRRLEIEGGGSSLSQVSAPATGLTKPVAKKPILHPVEKPADTGVIFYDAKGNVVTPTDAGLSKPAPALEIPAKPAEVVLPSPVGVLPVPGGAAAERVSLTVPVNAPASELPVKKDPEALQPASPAELNTAPAPESKVVPVAPPELSSTLVPSTQDLKAGSAAPKQAPSNFDIYNKAMELTKDTEAKAQITKVEEAKVTASKPVTPTEVLPSLKPVATPQVQEGSGAASGEGLGTPAAVAPVKVQTPALEDLGQPLNYNGPRRTEARPLPQLKFVPKAEPLKPANEVIQFEDEGSKL